jgi:hypothetical protein
MLGLQIFRRLRPLTATHPRPVFLLGHPKSGTTVIARLLASLSGETLTDDLFSTGAIKRPEVENLFRGQLTLRELVRRHPGRFATRLNKCPKLTYFHDQLAGCFPQARFIFIVRDPRATLRSFLGWRVIPGNADSLSDPVQRRQMDVLPAQPADHYISRLAQRWNQASDVYLHHPLEFALIRYEDFLVDPVQAIHDLAVAVGLEPRHDISGRVHVGYKTSGVRHVSYQAFFGESNLGRIESICADRMNAFGYA